MYYKDVQEHPTWLMTSLFMEQRFEEHVKNLYKVLPRLKDKGRKLNRDKCQLRLHKLTYFGHELSGRGMFASEEKVAAVVITIPPQNIAELETDHKPLECIFSRTSKMSARIERWVLRMQGYRYHVVYHPGKTYIADCLSRLNQANGKDPSGATEDFIRLIAAENTPCVMNGNLRKTPSWRLVMRGSRVVIPKSLREQVLKLAHEEHQGIVTTKSRLRTKVWWPKIDSDAERLCKSYHGCQVVGQFQPPEPMKCAEFPTGPCQGVAADLMGPLPSGENIVAVVDYYSRFFEVTIMHSATTPNIISALDEMFCRLIWIPIQYKNRHWTPVQMSGLKRLSS
ncbi:uncharacterized protein K02A2.6 [Exaiptasia diaphana]|uniref:Integrase zinc-binding domain-containing protein n=1 Tax=Exaiptasia diaphana TaxID=2652724 RepID=A0A913YMQ5_EXADI|nr:uncharacterized protein K02A2.6 [Exaiptasia diaphana]